MSDDAMKKSANAAANMTPRRISPPNVAKAVSPESRKRATEPVVVEDAFTYDVAMKFAFLGAGQGGGRMANAFWELGYRRIGMFNTTDSDFDGISIESRLSLDVGGAAKDTDLANKALYGREAEIHDLLAKAWGTDLDVAFICAGLGGGTGSGTIAKLVQIARKQLSNHPVPRIGAIVSLPPASEGQQVAKNAVNAFQQLIDLKVSPLIVIDNARINERYSPAMSKLHSTANEIVASMLDLFNRLAARRCPLDRLMTFDAGEFAQLLDNGIVTMGAAEIDMDTVLHPSDVSKKIREDLTKNVLATMDLNKGHKAACLFVGGQNIFDKYGMEYFESGFSQLDRIIGSARQPDPDNPPVIHRGVYSDPHATDLQCYTMVAGLEPPVQRLTELANKAGFTAQARTKLGVFLGVD